MVVRKICCLRGNEMFKIDVNTDSVAHRLMDFLKEEKVDQYDLMLVLSLLSLNNLNKLMADKKSVESASYAGTKENSSPVELMVKMLGRQSKSENQNDFDPSILLSLLGNKGQKPESALLMSLLCRLMKPPSSGSSCFPGDKRKWSTEKEIKTDNPELLLNWDQRLG